MLAKPKPRRKGVKVYRWKKLRDAYLAKTQVEDGLWRCAHCKQRITTPEVDHIIKRSVKPDAIFVESNLQILCHNCHLRKDSGLSYN